MADFYEMRLKELGLETGSHEVTRGRRNVWGVLKGTGAGPTILLAGHTDTVGVEGYDAPFDPVVKGDNLYGRGSCDMKAGLAAYLEVIRLLKSGPPLQGDVIVAGVVDEEHAMAGSKRFGEIGPHVDLAIVAEPSELKICPAHKGQILMSLQTHGVAAHSSLPQNGVNAVYHMARVVADLQDYGAALQTRAPDPMCGAPSFNVGVIRGGDNACSVPDFCEIDIDRRTIPGENHAEVIAEIETLLEAIQADTPDFRYDLHEPFLNLPPLDTAQDGALMQGIKDACQRVTGQQEVLAFPGSTDAPNFGCPTAICGPGNLAQCHSLDEYVSVTEIEAAVSIYLHAIAALQPG